MQNFHTLATHRGCHLDEILAILLLRLFGEALFPGVRTAKVVIWTSGGTPNGRLAEEYERDGILGIGVGGGRFDEHHLPPESAREECTATLVAEALGIREKPELRRILDFVLRTDRGPALHAFDLSSLVKVAHGAYPENEELIIASVGMELEAKVRLEAELLGLPKNERGKRLGWEGTSFFSQCFAKWCAERELRADDPALGQLSKFVEQTRAGFIHEFDLSAMCEAVKRVHSEATANCCARSAFEAKYREQRDFFLAVAEYPRIADEHLVRPRHQKPFMVAAINSPNSHMGRVARSERGCNAAIVIQRQPTGNVAILTDRKRLGEDHVLLLMDEVTRRIRGREHEVRGTPQPAAAILMKEEMGTEKCWSYQRRAGMLLNGSLSHPDVPPTSLSLEEVTEIVLRVAEEIL